MRMLSCVGYGFSIKDVSNESLIRLFKEKNKEEYDKVSSEDEETILRAIRKIYGSRPAFLIEIIDSEERQYAGVEIVEGCDEFIVFPPITFVDDFPKLVTYIKNRDDFKKMITKYIPIENVRFDSVYEYFDLHGSGYSFDY